MKLALYRMATTLGVPLIRLYLRRRRHRGKEDAVRFSERLGIASQTRPHGKLVWVHAASVGESLSALPVIARLRLDNPGGSILLTTGTVTSAKLMSERLPEGVLHHYVPVDRVAYVRRFLDHWRPDFAIWMESEFWPNLVIETHARGVPMAVLNARMSDRSKHKWQRHKTMIERLLSAFDLVLAQSECDAQRFRALGATHVQALGNLKFAASPLPVAQDDLDRLAAQTHARTVWLAASTHTGDETLCGRVHLALRAKIPDVLSIIAPRHPDRGAQVATELSAMGLRVARRAAGETPTRATDVYIADTLGEMGTFYRLAKVVFMGKSMPQDATKAGGGQNPIEPALLKCALIWGPDMSNFEGICEMLINAGAAQQIDDETALEREVERLLNDVNARDTMATRAHTIATAQAGVLGRVMKAIAPYVDARNESPTDART